VAQIVDIATTGQWTVRLSIHQRVDSHNGPGGDHRSARTADDTPATAAGQQHDVGCDNDHRPTANNSRA
jgi:hypothetical protein